MQNKLWLRIVCLLLCATLWSGCTLNKAMKSYEKGDYLASIRAVTARLDVKQDYPRNSLKKSWIDSVHLSLNQIENLSADHLEQRLQRLEMIYQARLLVGSGFYASHFVGFNQRYPMPQLKLDIAQLYYQKGNHIVLHSTENYREKAEAYTAGLGYADYLNSAELAAKYSFEYAKRLAEEYYQSGIAQAKLKNYQSASEDFEKASQAYLSYGKYKDAQQLLSKYDQLWRTEKASQLFSQASLKDQSAIRKVDFRAAAQLYKDADDVFKAYGRYKNAATLATAAERKGRVQIAYYIDQERGDDRCGAYSSERLSERLRTQMNNTFKSDPFELLNSRTRSSRAAADIEVYITYRSYFKLHQPQERHQVQSVLDRDGKVLKFNQRTEFKRSEYEIQVQIETQGDVNIRKSIALEDESEQQKIDYSGDVPAAYYAKTLGSLKQQDELCIGLSQNLARQIQYVLDDIVKQGKRI